MAKEFKWQISEKECLKAALIILGPSLTTWIQICRSITFWIFIRNCTFYWAFEYEQTNGKKKCDVNNISTCTSTQWIFNGTIKKYLTFYEKMFKSKQLGNLKLADHVSFYRKDLSHTSFGN